MSDQGEVSTGGSSAGEVEPAKMVISAPDGAIIIERNNVEERQLLQRIAETLELLTDRLGIKPQIQVPSYVITDHAPRTSNREGQQPAAEPFRRRASDYGLSAEGRSRRASDHEAIKTLVKHHHHINWMQLINFTFVTVMALSLILPSFLSSVYGIALHPASVAHPEFSINRGDVLVTNFVPVTSLAPRDLILTSNDLTWEFDVNSIYAISQPDSAGMITLTEAGSGNFEDTEDYTVRGSTKIHKITNVIPRITNLASTANLIFVKIAVVLLVLFLNILTYVRRWRRKRAAWL